MRVMTLLLLGLALGALVLYGRREPVEPLPPPPRDPGIAEAALITLQGVEPHDRTEVLRRFARSRSFGRVAWRSGVLYCFLTRPGQEVEPAFAQQLLGDAWRVEAVRYDRDLPPFGTLEPLKDSP